MDFQLHQAVRETRALAATRQGEPWARLRAALQAVADAMGRQVDDAAYDRQADRLEREQLYDEPYEAVVGGPPTGDNLDTPSSVVAALYAVYDQPSDEHATTAAEALERLHDTMG